LKISFECEETAVDSDQPVVLARIPEIKPRKALLVEAPKAGYAPAAKQVGCRPRFKARISAKDENRYEVAALGDFVTRVASKDRSNLS